jgi:hypothetical protein
MSYNVSPYPGPGMTCVQVKVWAGEDKWNTGPDFGVCPGSLPAEDGWYDYDAGIACYAPINICTDLYNPYYEGFWDY